MKIDTDRIKVLLEDYSVSTSDMARYMGVTRQAIDRIRKQDDKHFYTMQLGTAMRFQKFLDMLDSKEDN